MTKLMVTYLASNIRQIFIAAASYTRERRGAVVGMPTIVFIVSIIYTVLSNIKRVFFLKHLLGFELAVIIYFVIEFVRVTRKRFARG